jgi:hypothetical protein
MEIKPAAFAAALAGMFFLSLIGLFFHWVGWKEEAASAQLQITDHLTRLERYWSQKHHVNVRYDAIEAEGFPFDLRIRMIKPRLTVNTGNGVVMIGSNYLDFVPADDRDDHHLLYELHYMQDGYLRWQSASGQVEDYFLHLSAKPQLVLRKEPVGSKMPPTFNMYGYLMPSQLSLLVTKGEKSAPVPFHLPMQQQQVMWRPMTADLITPALQLLGILQRSMK